MPEVTYKKVSLAIEQLDMAISILLSGSNLVCSLTLAGAAEEILGRALQHRGEQNSLQFRYEALRPVYEIFSPELAWRRFADEENHAKNSVKHMSDDSDVVSLDLHSAAWGMILRACDNIDRLGFERTPRMKAFEDWFFENIVGSDFSV